MDDEKPAGLVLEQPAAILQLWWEGPPDQLEEAARLASADTVSAARLTERTWALLPRPGIAAIFDAALAWGSRLVERLTALSPATRSRALIAPGRVEASSAGATLVGAPLDADDVFASLLAPGAMHLTSYAMRALEARWELTVAGTVTLSSGRTVPIHRVAGQRPHLPPFRNPQALGRTLRWIERPLEEARVAAFLKGPGFLLEAPLGAGKSRLVFELLQGRGARMMWSSAEISAAGVANLATQLARSLPPEPGRAGIANDRGALLDRLGAEARRSPAPLWLVFDDLHAATERERSFVDELLSIPERNRPFRTALLARPGGLLPARASGLSRARLLPFSASEWDRFETEVFRGLALPPQVAERLLAAVATNPFALEESLVALARDKQLRQVFGSFFYSGGESVADFQSSDRWQSHVAAELDRCGEADVLRLLATVGEPAPPREVASAVYALTGRTPSPDWGARAIAAGLAEEVEGPWGPGIRFASPALADAAAATLGVTAFQRARRELGEQLGALAPTTAAAWSAYRLLAGSKEGLELLLSLSPRATQLPREELFEALLAEHAAHRARGGDVGIELDLIWALLPLARRLGRLALLGDTIERAVTLAATQTERPERLVAFSAVKAELEQKSGRLAEAVATLRKALAAARGTTPRRQALVLVDLGRVLLRAGRLDEARELFERTLAVAEKSTTTSLAATCRFFLGNIALHEFRLDDAETLHAAALETRRSARLFAAVGQSLSAVGAVALAQGNAPGALEAYREGQALLSEHGSEGEEAFALLGVGRALARLGDLTGATAPIRSALALREGRDDRFGEAIARLALAENQLGLDQLESALAEARKAHFALSLTAETEARADAEQLLGRIFARLRRLREAAAHLEEAATLHLLHRRHLAVLFDLAYRLDVALAAESTVEVGSAFEALASERERFTRAPYAEIFDFALYRGAQFLRKRAVPTPDPTPFMRRAYHALVKQTTFLPPEMRQRFLFQIEAHRRIVDAATEAGISFPPT